MGRHSFLLRPVDKSTGQRLDKTISMKLSVVSLVSVLCLLGVAVSSIMADGYGFGGGMGGGGYGGYGGGGGAGNGGFLALIGLLFIIVILFSTNNTSSSSSGLTINTLNSGQSVVSNTG